MTMKTSASKAVNRASKEALTSAELENEAPKAPDGGYGWVIVFASFMANTIVDGIAYSFGIMLPEFVNHYKGSVQTAAWVGSLLTGVYMLVGPLASGLVNKYGARFVCILGSALGTVAFISSVWAPSLSVLMITYGVLGGIGFGFIYLPACVYVSYYFDKKRALATGIAVAGSGFGTFVFAPLTVALIETFCWQGSLWIMAAIIANCAVCGALLWPLRPKVVVVSEMSSASLSQILEEDGELTNDNEKVQLVPPAICIRSPEGDETNLHGKNGGVASHKFFKVSAENVAHYRDKLKHHNRSLSYQVINRQFSHNHRSSSVQSLRWASNRQIDIGKPFSKQDIFYPGSVSKIPELKASRGSLVEQRDAFTIKETDGFIDNITVESVQQQQAEKKLFGFLPAPVTRVLLNMVDLHLLKNRAMMILCVSNIVGMLGFYVPFVYMSSYSEALGNSKESSSLLLSVIGITNTIGRVLFGWVSDQHWVAALTINNWSLLICGMLTSLCLFFTSYSLLMMYCVFFGLFIAPYVSLSAVILVEEIGLEHLTNAFGLLILSRGLSAILGTPVGGAIFDMTGSYGVSFFVAGVLIFISGLISYTIPLLRYVENRKKAKRTPDA